MNLKVIAVLGTLALILGILAVPAQPAMAATTPSISTYPSVVIKGESFEISGDLGTEVDRPVTLQRLSGTTWSTLETTASFSGWYEFKPTSVSKSTTFRTVADPVTLDGVNYPQVITTKKVTPVGQSVKASMPKSGYQGQSLVVSVKTTPSRDRTREMRLQIRKAGKWVTTDADASAYKGKGVLSFTTEKPGTYYYRVFMPSLNGTATMVTPKMKIKVKKRSGYHAKAIALGNGFACAINYSNGVDCWGKNIGGLKNTAAHVKKPSPVLGLTGVQALSARGENVCALISGGQVKCWGDDQYGQLGDGTTGGYSKTPLLIPGVSGATAVSVGPKAVCVILAREQVSCQGYGSNGQLGRAPAYANPTPAVIPGLSDVKAVSVGVNVTCAANEDGTVKCLGENTYGELGAGRVDTSTSNYSATPVSAVGVSGAVSLDGGDGNSTYSCAVSGTGELRCWPGPAENGRVPYLVPDLSGVTGVAVGDAVACATESSGKVECWGDDDYEGITGRGDYGDDPSDTPLPVYFMNDAVSIKLGTFACAIRRSGQVSCWGENGFGELGGGTTSRNRTTPTNVVAP